MDIWILLIIYVKDQFDIFKGTDPFRGHDFLFMDRF